MFHPKEKLNSLLSSERNHDVAVSVGCTALAGLLLGVEVGLLERETIAGLIAGIYDIPIATIAAGAGCHAWGHAFNSPSIDAPASGPDSPY